MKEIIVVGMAAIVCAAVIGCQKKDQGGDTQPDIMSSETGGGEDVGSPVGRVEKRGDDSVTARMGLAGGRVELASGIRIDVPANAVQKPHDVVFKIAPPTTAFLNEEDERAVGPLVVFTPSLEAPEGSNFVVSYPLSSIPEEYDESNLYLAHEEVGRNQRDFAENTTVTTWDYTKAQLIGGRVTAELGYLSGMRLQFVLSK